jgi:outer membrane protein OmpA-like peptidoglycan-associated protein
MVLFACSHTVKRPHSFYRRDLDRQEIKDQRIIRENSRIIDDLVKRGAVANHSSRGIVVDLPDVYFDFDKDTIKPIGSRILKHIARVILQSARYRPIAVEGHTDSIGQSSYNRRLSMLRARSVAAELVAHGLDARQIAARGFGESQPIASNASEKGRRRNRRVEIYIENRK